LPENISGVLGARLAHYSVVWSRDGKQIYYLSAEDALMVVDVNAKDGVSDPSEPPRVLAENEQVPR
jgi:hypothetical protein